jgi:hypothetical protein
MAALTEFKRPETVSPSARFAFDLSAEVVLNLLTGVGTHHAGVGSSEGRQCQRNSLGEPHGGCNESVYRGVEKEKEVVESEEEGKQSLRIILYTGFLLPASKVY